MRWVQMFLSLLVGATLLASCETGQLTQQSQSDYDALEGRVVEEYHLGSGDQIRIIVFGEEELSGEFVVDGSGFISLPLIGEVMARGKTIREFQRSMEAALREGYLNDPRVSAEVLNFRPFYILGEVEESGEYPYSDGLTVLNAVATAGGFTYRANTRFVFIKRSGAANEVQYPLTATTPVQPGDTIRIAERFF
ncbi:polysaccharide biosynthesis/export family protein [Ponticaulis sp.]|uniref:polysaccharide biosynthesis/export family protein n=1 Tax=Ponticaulis sp. TaxID=2020902 RepID=UPI000B64C35B|nr:polysaccharide biosynthesis/export family protein [Ponticaulis sp.]MAJ07542.1 polysaccharide biosynthesis protein [Ponticaulis sp.]RPG17773.1 MAG: polysaccharide export protein [Hyphomonadaceae bacterium TMED125]HBH90058.1 polysaccharide biosynthesis protein [Hyphomonadaceae bacterium]